MCDHLCLFQIPVHMCNPPIGRYKLPDRLTYLNHLRPWDSLHTKACLARYMLKEAAKLVQLLIREAILTAVMKLESEHDRISVAGVAGRIQVQDAMELTGNQLTKFAGQI